MLTVRGLRNLTRSQDLKDDRYKITESKPLEPLFPWQIEIKLAITRMMDNSCVIVSVPPAAGKTRPILQALYEIIGSFKIKNANIKILYCVPIQQLISNVLSDINNEFENLDQQTKTNLLDQISIGIKVGEGTVEASLTGEVPTEHTTIDIATYEYAASLSKTFRYFLTIIDEFQEVAPLRHDPEIFQKAKSYSTIILNSRRLVLISGSLNRNVLTELADVIKEYTNISDVKIVPGNLSEHPTATNRTKLVVLGTADVTTVDKLFKFVYTRIVNRMSNTLVIIFSRSQIYRFCEKLIKVLPKIMEINPPPGMTYVDSDNVALEKANLFAKDCIERGFGFIIGGMHTPESERSLIDKALTLSQKEKDMIASLFSSGKIYVLFATDAVGLGVTLSVQTLVIPQIKKFTGNGFHQLDESSLVQVLHRAGRGKFPVAYIITSPDNEDEIKSMLSKNPVIDIKPADISDLKKLLILGSPKKMSFSERLIEIFSSR